eukprot:1176049-Prorocentrum_minimum.AAC.1
MGAGLELKAFDVDNKMGSEALTRVYTDVLGSTTPMPGVQMPHVEGGGFGLMGKDALKYAPAYIK